MRGERWRVARDKGRVRKGHEVKQEEFYVRGSHER